MLVEHLPYEISMLEFSYGLLANPTHNNLSDGHRNLIIECFFLHSRNLIEFFDRRKQEGRTAAACEFTAQEIDYQIKPDLRDRINDQVSYLNYDRGRNANKLSGNDILLLKDAIDRAIERFQDSLDADARKHWAIRKQSNIHPSVDLYPSATNHVTALSSRGTSSN